MPTRPTGIVSSFDRRPLCKAREFFRAKPEILEQRRVLATVPQSLANIHGSLGSNPREFVEVGAWTFFTADDGVRGRELWKTNGTTAGTMLVADIRPGSDGSDPSALVNLNGTLFFAADNGDGVHGRELWKSNGTSTGTVIVRDVSPGLDDQFDLYPQPVASSDPRNLTNVNGTLFFTAYSQSIGFELWKSNGTSTGTVLVRDIVPGRLFAQSGMIFTPYDSNPRQLTNANGLLYFVADDTPTIGQEPPTLWKSDGTSTGTVKIKPVTGSIHTPANLTNVNGTLFFSADDGTRGQELWKTNGTSAGTTIVLNIRPGVGGSIATAGSADGNLFANVNGTLYFNADDGIRGRELWKSNGTSAGTVLVSDLNSGSHYDSTLKKSVPNAGNPVQLTNVNGTLFFSAYDATRGRELWRSNGTSSGTAVVRDLRPNIAGSSPGNLMPVGGSLLFTADDGSRGTELWRTDGTSAGTILLRDTRPGASGASISELARAGQFGFFAADDGVNGAEPWIFALNVAPVLDVAKSPALKTMPKNAGMPVGAVGTLVAGLIYLNGTYKNASDADVGAVAGIAVTKVDTAPGSWFYTLNNGSTWLPLSASTNAAKLLAADAGTRIYFRPTAGYQGTMEAALTFRAWDRTAGTNGATLNVTGGGGYTSFSRSGDTASITVVNNAPVLDVAKSPTLNSVSRNAAAPAGAVGTLVGALVALNGAAKNVGDADAGAVTGIAVTKLDTANGSWFYSLNNGGTWLALTASTAAAKLLAADASTRIYFKPTAGFQGTIASAITFRAWDRTSGVNGGTTNVSTFLPSSSFSKLGDTASIVVT